MVAILMVTTAAPGRTVGVGPESPTCVPQSRPPEIGIELVETKRKGRLVELVLQSSAVQTEQRHGAPGEQHVNVLLPVGFDHRSPTRYPVLYLLHGFTGDYTDYVDDLQIKTIVGDRPVIVVMPDDGYNGAYTDWYGRTPGIGGEGEPPAWESYHMLELVPLIDELFPTLGTREGRAIAGISSGAGGVKYAARYPHLFAAAGSMSGAVDLNLSRGFGVEQQWYPTVDFVLNTSTVPPGTGPAAYCKFGDPYTQEVFWRDNNPTYLASNLHGVALWLSSGDATDPDDPNTFDSVEWAIRQMHLSFVDELDRAGVPHTDLFRAGTHTAPFWIDDLRLLIPWVMRQFAQPQPPPSTFSYRSMGEALTPWGWRVDAPKEVKEFTYLNGVSRRGLTITGSGFVAVTTPPLYRAGDTYEVRAGDDVRPVVAGPDRRLRFDVDLGDPHLVQQYDFGPDATDGWVTEEVRISRVRAPG